MFDGGSNDESLHVMRQWESRQAGAAMAMMAKPRLSTMGLAAGSDLMPAG